MVENISGMLDFKGKAVMVTGGGSGLGVGIARRFAQAGADVFFTYLSARAPEENADELRSFGVRAEYMPLDQRDADGCKKAVHTAYDTFGRLDVLVNNSAIHGRTPTMEIDQAIWDEMMEINLRGAFFCAQTAGALMVKQGDGGAIVSISTINSWNPLDNACHYGVSKAGINHFTRSLAKELGGSGIRVNAIAPGLIEAEGLEAAVPGWRQRFIDRSALRKTGTQEDVANICLFLASPMSDWITGQTIIADGGVMLAPWY